MPLYSRPQESAALMLWRSGAYPDPEEDEALKPAPRMEQPAQTQTLEQPHAPSLPQQNSQAAQMVKRYTDPAEQQRTTAWLRSQIPQNTTQQHQLLSPTTASPPPSGAWTKPARRSLASPRPVNQPQGQDLSRPINASTVPLTGQPAHPAASLPPPDLTRSGIPQNTTYNHTQPDQAVMHPGALTPEKQQLHADLNRLLSPAATSASPTPQEQALLQQLAERSELSAKPQPPPAPASSTSPASTGDDPKVAAALRQAGAEVAAESAARQQREARRAKLQSAGMSGAASSLEALEDEAQARRTALERAHAPGTPEHQAGMQAINNHVQQQQAQIAAKADQLPQIAAKIYQQWGHGVAGNWITGEALKGNEEYSPGAPLSSTHLDVLDQEAKKYGVDPKDLRHHMEMQRLSDWSRASTNYANKQQESLVDRTVKQVSGRGPAEPTRVLPNGSITVNPALGEDQAAFEKAIENTYSSPEAKAAARKLWPAYHDHWLNTARAQLETSQTLPGVENYQQWRERNQLEGNLSVKDAKGNVTGFLTPNQTAQRYLDEMKARPGWRKFADNISTSLTAGGGQVVAGVFGAAALAQNSFQSLTGLNVGGQAVSEAAAGMARQNQALTQSHELTGTIDGLGGRVVSGVAQAVPGIGAAVATGGAAGGAALGFVQGAGSTYTDLYQHHIDQGMSPEQAHRAAAGTAIASGAVSAALGKVFSGGANALNNPATREAAKKSFGSAVKSFLKGAADEIPQEVLDSGFTHIASEMNKGSTFEQAAKSYAEQFPQSALTAALLGGTLHTAASHRADTQTPAKQPDSASGSGKQPQTLPPPTTPPKSPEKSQQLIDNVSKMPAQAQQHPQVQADLNQAKGVVVQDAQKVIDNISKMPAQAQQHPQVQEKLAEAKKVVADHAPKPETQSGSPSAPQVPEGPSSTTHSSGGSQPPGTSATTHGDTPPTGHNTDTHTGEGDNNATTATANSSNTTNTSAKATGKDTHTASSNAQPISTGTEIPLPTTSPQEIDLARKITNNLDKVQAKRPLNPREQADYDKARNLLDRAAPNLPGTRNTGNPKDLVLAGDGPISQTHDAAADVPPPEPAQPANAVGTTIQGPVTTNPDAPTASANGGSGNSNAPFVLTQQQQIPAQGSGPTNAATNGNGQPPATVQDSPVASLTSPVPKLQGPQLPFAPSPNLEWHIPHDPSRHLLPDKPFDATRKPTGPPKVLDKNDTNIHNKRGVDGENETAEVLAQNGYDYEQVSQNKERISNGTWAGKADGVFGKAPNSKSDVYSPSAQTNLRNIYETVVGKVDRQKSPYVIVRLEPGGQSIEDISKKFQENPIKDLKQLFVIKEGKLHIIY